MTTLSNLDKQLILSRAIDAQVQIVRRYAQIKRLSNNPGRFLSGLLREAEMLKTAIRWYNEISPTPWRKRGGYEA